MLLREKKMILLLGVWLFLCHSCDKNIQSSSNTLWTIFGGLVGRFFYYHINTVVELRYDFWFIGDC